MFESFVVLAEMRTGSNYLESNLNAFDGITCYGEAFNPFFIGHKGKERLLGVTRKERNDAPERLLGAMKGQTEGISGFRLFFDHDARVREAVLSDPTCAKIILTRNPLDSYVSLQIARQTGQWMLTDARHKKAAKITFDPVDFATYLHQVQTTHRETMARLQATGQAAFFVRYDDIGNLDVLNGLATYLGVSTRLESLSGKLKKQNPAALEDKVANFAEMRAAIAEMDLMGLSEVPQLEPKRHAMVPSYVAATGAPLLYMPVPGGPVEQVESFLSMLGEEPLRRGFNQKALRQWKRQNPSHRSFAVVTHPLLRAHRVFCTKILPTGPGNFPEIRNTLRRVYDLPLPDDGPGTGYSVRDHRKAFLAFLKFLGDNLAGRTSIRVDAAWASQHVVLEGMSGFTFPDMVIREEDMADALPFLARQTGLDDIPAMSDPVYEQPFQLIQIYDGAIEKAARDVYQRDFMTFGYRAFVA
ncbi:nodulation protein NodH [Actibacterium mucosum KCTC 23349]|uniref:Nodulation protein NodH n=1 Tax=Actibacterium mucosum KCTC 23349 TaxID=1454373 RepID=A0A037ZNS6_9RHOB|nr:nodulation protein NodH [Actibacterium mucosum]KAJ57310.1 nodulation protein NodH [Actibacterium mucosum KCTC 23349]